MQTNDTGLRGRSARSSMVRNFSLAVRATILRISRVNLQSAGETVQDRADKVLDIGLLWQSREQPSLVCVWVVPRVLRSAWM